MRLSTSFSEEEILFLDELMRLMSRGGDPSIILRNKSFAGVARKVLAMKERFAKKADKPVEEEEYDPYGEGNQLGALNPGEEPDDGG